MIEARITKKSLRWTRALTRSATVNVRYASNEPKHVMPLTNVSSLLIRIGKEGFVFSALSLSVFFFFYFPITTSLYSVLTTHIETRAYLK